MKLVFADEAWEDHLYWQKHDPKMVERINKLIREVQREPFSGIGKPEPLKHALSSFWSRRITEGAQSESPRFAGGGFSATSVLKLADTL